MFGKWLAVLCVAGNLNYIKATEFSIRRFTELPLCNRLIKETHAVLIGGQGSTLKNARYIPPTPEDMSNAMSDLEKYMNTDDSLDVLIRAALIHYQFETIHPFLDGNGRLGRLLITLFLMEKGVLTTPALYISYFLKKNRVEYYDRMNEVHLKGNYEQWVKFFLQALYESAEDAVAAIDELTALHNKKAALIEAMGRSAANGKRVFEYVEANPIIEIKKTAQALSLAFNTVSGVVNRLMEAGILVQTDNRSRNRTFSYEAYLKILRKGT